MRQRASQKSVSIDPFSSQKLNFRTIRIPLRKNPLNALLLGASTFFTKKVATQVTPEVKTSAKEGSFTVVELDEGTQITHTSSQQEVKHAVSGNAIVGGAKMTNSAVVSRTEAGETNEVLLSSKYFKGGVLQSKGQGSTNFSLEGTKFHNSAAKHGNSDDSISFTGTTVKSAKIQMSGGSDTVTFGASTEFRGTTKVNLGSGGADVAEFDSAIQSKNPKGILNKFDEQDILKVGGVEVTSDDLQNGDADQFTGIKINFVD